MTDGTVVAADRALRGLDGFFEGFSPAQVEAVEMILRWFREGSDLEFYLAGFAGSGKTTTAGALIAYLATMGMRLPVGAYTGKAASVLRKKGLTHADTIHSQMYTAVEGSNPVRFVRSIDSSFATADLITIDECFVKSTIVDTPFGGKLISDHRTGDFVMNAFGVDRVVVILKKEAVRVAQVTLNTGQAPITCSEDHRFFTARGLIRARDFQLGDRLAPTREAMRFLREELRSNSRDEKILFKQLRTALVESISRISRESTYQRTNGKVHREASRAGSQSCWGKSSRVAQERRFETFYATRGCCENSKNDARTWTVSEDIERWKRTSTTESSSRSSFCSGGWMAYGIRSEDRKTQEAWLADLLQDRHRESGEDDRDRSGWAISRLAGEERTRREERIVSSWPRVDCVEILESRDPRLDRERETDGKLYLYDLAIDRHHSYSVSGILTHNCSMVGPELAGDLRSYGRKILVLGDPGQLPPIGGAGAFTNREPDAFLTEIHRQAAESPILKLATHVRLGNVPEWSEDLSARVSLLTWDEVDSARGQIICGTHRARWAITARVRERLGFSGLFPAVGERVICRKNDRDLGLYNGMLGVVEDDLGLEEADGGVTLGGLNDESVYRRFTVRMDDLHSPVEVLVDPTPFREHQLRRRLEPPGYRKGVQLFDFGHVLTVHSAQGSEWEEVTIIDDSSAFRENRHKWLYTAVTRASNKLTLLRRQ